MNLKLKCTPGIYVVGFMASGKSTVGRLLPSIVQTRMARMNQSA